ncbi:response regulator [Methylovulum psychrotolerans]|jgi:two-component system KDP operon response regulator KdpE|uniref:DNA-binding response regulator n=1 Tax=Methylovulum psychrotolerans TaxID=1704499 RepID=A0A1Z4C3E6_9GAMM|nr:response regulator [Methylovulum psychrotolerans]ASF48035.1 DNA-binding response regulator [Methylovulum psychrotolerans]
MTEQTPLLLLIEDDPPFRSLLATTLEGQGYRVLATDTGREGLLAVRNRSPALLLLDLGLPDMDGQDVICRLRKSSELPVIVLSARHQESDVTQALDNGADDYLTKPFSNAELMARINALLRRVAKLPGGVQEVFQVGGLKVELTKRRVFTDGCEVHLTPLEFSLLSVLVRHAGFVVTHRHLLEKVWGASYIEHSHYLRIYMGQLRHKLEADPARPRYLLTEAGIGYRLFTDDAP